MALPKAQGYPSSKIKVGAVLYRVTADMDDERKTSSEIEEWVVRSIRAKRGSKSINGVSTRDANSAAQYVNLTRKLDYVTWGRRSKKTGDYGWLKSIPNWAVKQFPVGGDLPTGLYTTPRAALVYAIADTEWRVERCKVRMGEETAQSEIDEWQRNIEDLDAQIVALNRRLSKLSSK